MTTRILPFAAILAVALGCAPKAPPASASKTTPTPAPVSKTTPAPVAPANPPTAAPTATPSPAEPAYDLESPTQVIQKYTEELRSIVDPAREKGKTDTVRERRIADKVRQFFDFEGLARMALGRHWNRITPAQRTEYRELFVSLVEDSYLRKSRDLVGEYKIVYGREEVKGNRAKVVSRVARSDADVEISYELHRNPKNWMIFNIILDDVDLIGNYQTQFNRIIEQRGIEDLLGRMRKKLDETEKEAIY
jgi:phospholipid transport system substrate-binding protein